MAGGAAQRLDFSSETFVAGSGVRRLTPVECERLMGFPDDYTRIAWRNKPVEQCPDRPRYRCLGNSMVANVLVWLFRRIDAVKD